MPLLCATYLNVAAKEFGHLRDGQKNLLYACDAKTSMMMALEPELADEMAASKALAPSGGGEVRGVHRKKNVTDISPNGVVGSPHLATPKKGEALLKCCSNGAYSAHERRHVVGIRLGSVRSLTLNQA